MEFVTIEAQGERAVIVPQAGFQCLSYRVSSLELIAGPADPAEWQEKPFRSGIPLLFPWPGRIRDGVFSWRGRDIRLPINDPGHNCAIHGLTYKHAFTVTRRGPYFVAARLDSSAEPELSRVWPYPFVLDLDYEIGSGLRLHMAVANTGQSPMPFGFGAHPYFHAPLDPQGSRASIQIEGQVDGRWQTDDRLLPTGKLEPPSGRMDLRKPVTLGSDTYDDPFRLAAKREECAARMIDPFRLATKRKECAARMIDPKLKMALELRAAPAFRDLVVYAPPGKDVVALEPYTCMPDAFNLAAKGVDSGVIELAPGARFETSFEIRLSAP